MKCAICSTKVVRGALESVCPECGWRSPSSRQLRESTIVITAVLLLVIPLSILRGEPILGIHESYWTVILCVGLVLIWMNYVVVKRRRNRLGYDS